ncbi:MAG: accessory factor UbiK family protein [Halothiobacillaceae bacterium]|nr:MAG: accessory factor UbiK family protein [Halothiobacillaceae bacterium]
MFDPKQLDELARKIGESIPAGLSDLRDDIEKTARLGLQQMIERMELVTREEFEVQQAVLERTRARLEALEHRVAALEAEARGALQ